MTTAEDYESIANFVYEVDPLSHTPVPAVGSHSAPTRTIRSRNGRWRWLR